MEDLSRDNNEQSNYLKDLYLFFKSPIVKFAYHKTSFLLFLMFFSYYVLCDYPVEGNDRIKWIEIILILWVYSYFIEALQQCYIQDTKLYFTKLKLFLTDYWNMFDLIAILIFTIGLILRYIPNSENCFIASK